MNKSLIQKATNNDASSIPQAVASFQSHRSDKDAKAAASPISISDSPLKASKKPRVIEATS